MFSAFPGSRLDGRLALRLADRRGFAAADRQRHGIHPVERYWVARKLG